MKTAAKQASTLLLALITGLGIFVALWPVASAALVYGDILPDASVASAADAWAPLALVRLLGVLVALSGGLVLALVSESRATRWAFAAVAMLAVLVTVAQWRAIFPFGLGLLATVVVSALAVFGLGSLGRRTRELSAAD